MAIKTANDLFVSQLRDLSSAEKQAVRMYPKIAKAARSEELKEALHGHLEETKAQRERLEQVFELLGKKSSGKTCEAMKGLLEEVHEALKGISKGPVLDAAIIAAVQCTEHLEIASYGTVMAFAEAMGFTEIQNLLAATLREEKAVDSRLSEIAISVNALLIPKPEIEEDDSAEAKPAKGRAAKTSPRKKVPVKLKKS